MKKNFLEPLKKAGVFPFIPFVPLVLLGGSLVLSALSLFKVRRLARSLEATT
jgi:hypothetical protein